MSCEKKDDETKRVDEAMESPGEEGAGCCACGSCSSGMKWLCLAGLGTALGYLAFRSLRRSAAS